MDISFPISVPFDRRNGCPVVYSGALTGTAHPTSSAHHTRAQIATINSQRPAAKVVHRWRRWYGVAATDAAGSPAMSQVAPPAVVTFSSPVDIVSAIPSMLGFHPVESLVVMCLRGPRHRTGLTMRIDLVDPEYDERFAAETAARVATDKAGAAIVVCYTDVPAEADRLPRAGLVDQVGGQLLRRGIELAEALLVREGRWFS